MQQVVTAERGPSCTQWQGLPLLAPCTWPWLDATAWTLWAPFNHFQIVCSGAEEPPASSKLGDRVGRGGLPRFSLKVTVWAQMSKRQEV